MALHLLLDPHLDPAQHLGLSEREVLNLNLVVYSGPDESALAQ